MRGSGRRLLAVPAWIPTRATVSSLVRQQISHPGDNECHHLGASLSVATYYPTTLLVKHKICKHSKREGPGFAEENVLRTRIPPPSPTSPLLTLIGQGAVRIVAPGAEDERYRSCREKESPRVRSLPRREALARAFKTSKVSPATRLLKTKPGVHSVATSSAKSTLKSTTTSD
jgi:hypothetical protein